MTHFSRRSFILGTLALSAQALPFQAALAQEQHPLYGGLEGEVMGRDPSLFPPPESPVDFPIERVDLDKIPEKFHRQMVGYGGMESPGTIIVDPTRRFLYLVQEDNSAIRYGVGVGRQGFAWSGEAVVQMKRRWPRWIPPEEMTYRDAHAAEWNNGMPGGPNNPLGARALYLFSNGQDTLYRIHGTNEPNSIGKAMSSGCIRMLNEDVADLFDRVPKGSKVIVLAGSI
ncbi:MAG: L,D-transpeptidase [Rhizobiales bacterium]|nr:L,D-transpeptidase [Hyphomicrobiales bacterium]